MWATTSKVDDGFNILNLKVKEAEKDRSLNFIASTYDPYDNVIRDGLYDGGRKIISFSGVLQQGVFPLPELLQMSMKYGSEAMRRPVEIEFACNLNSDRTGSLYSCRYAPLSMPSRCSTRMSRQCPTSGVWCVPTTRWDTE